MGQRDEVSSGQTSSFFQHIQSLSEKASLSDRSESESAVPGPGQLQYARTAGQIPLHFPHFSQGKNEGNEGCKDRKKQKKRKERQSDSSISWKKGKDGWKGAFFRHQDDFSRRFAHSCKTSSKKRKSLLMAALSTSFLLFSHLVCYLAPIISLILGRLKNEGNDVVFGLFLLADWSSDASPSEAGEPDEQCPDHGPAHPMSKRN